MWEGVTCRALQPLECILNGIATGGVTKPDLPWERTAALQREVRPQGRSNKKLGDIMLAQVKYRDNLDQHTNRGGGEAGQVPDNISKMEPPRFAEALNVRLRKEARMKPVKVALGPDHLSLHTKPCQLEQCHLRHPQRHMAGGIPRYPRVKTIPT